MKSEKNNFSNYIFLAIFICIYLYTYTQKNPINFSLLLTIAIFISGCTYAFKLFWLKNKKLANANANNLLDETSSLLPLLLAVFILRSFVIEPFRIPSCSLEPTLLVGDFVAVNKFAYGIRLPILEKKIIEIGQPKRGDIVVFRWPPNPKFDFIKRVIGLPGDKISYKNKQLYINDEIVDLEEIPLSIDKVDNNVKEFIESLPGQTHHILQRQTTEPFDFEVTVPAGYYLVMGDNRDDSADSRYWGFVPDNHLRGKAFGIWMSWDNQHYRVRFNRIGKAIH